ncbi:hypothetical protein ABNF97_09385 [Plantactinospora sp. B6F1]|uniref:hypothetical protein n=1 Tax=Plantactinospora sp. B6F1 TaxID=3158971 RepID=UPI0032D8FEE2
MPPHNRRLKQIEFAMDSVSFECQVQNWTMQNNTEDGEKQFTQCPDGEFREETDPDYALELTFFSDWRENGISDWLTQNDGELVAFTLDHHPDIAAEHVQWTGELYVKAPSVGGEARATEQTEVTLQVVGKPTYTRVGA